MASRPKHVTYADQLMGADRIARPLGSKPNQIPFIDGSGVFTLVGGAFFGGDVDTGFGSDMVRVVGIGTDGSFTAGKTGVFRFADTNNQLETTNGGTMIGKSFWGWEFFQEDGGGGFTQIVKMGQGHGGDVSAYFFGVVDCQGLAIGGDPLDPGTWTYGVDGTFTAGSGETVTVQKGMITSIV